MGVSHYPITLSKKDFISVTDKETFFFLKGKETQVHTRSKRSLLNKCSDKIAPQQHRSLALLAREMEQITYHILLVSQFLNVALGAILLLPPPSNPLNDGQFICYKFYKQEVSTSSLTW